MACQMLKQKIYDTLRAGYFNSENDFVDVSDGFEDFVHIVIVSPKFKAYTLKDRDDLIWDEIVKGLSDKEWRQVSLLIGTTPEEVRIW